MKNTHTQRVIKLSILIKLFIISILLRKDERNALQCSENYRIYAGSYFILNFPISTYATENTNAERHSTWTEDECTGYDNQIQGRVVKFPTAWEDGSIHYTLLFSMEARQVYTRLSTFDRNNNTKYFSILTLPNHYMNLRITGRMYHYLGANHSIVYGVCTHDENTGSFSSLESNTSTHGEEIDYIIPVENVVLLGWNNYLYVENPESSGYVYGDLAIYAA